MTPLTNGQIEAERLAAGVGKSTSSYAFAVQRICDSHEALRAKVETLTAENAERAEAIAALLEDRLMADGRSVHLLICNFQDKKQGDRYCNCQLGNRINKSERERDTLRAENAALHAQIVATAWVRAEDQETR